MAILFGGIVWYSYSLFLMISHMEISANKIIFGFTALKQLLLGIGFGSLVVYFIKWNNSWFQRHADEEFRLKRLEIDVDRASWIVEMALEWKERGHSEIPLPLIEKLSANIFETGDRRPEEKSPADQLASAILGESAKLKLMTTFGEIELDRKGIKELKKDIQVET
jgi:hypothetical protein